MFPSVFVCQWPLSNWVSLWEAPPSAGSWFRETLKVHGGWNDCFLLLEEQPTIRYIGLLDNHCQRQGLAAVKVHSLAAKAGHFSCRETPVHGLQSAYFPNCLLESVRAGKYPFGVLHLTMCPLLAWVPPWLSFPFLLTRSWHNHHLPPCDLLDPILLLSCPLLSHQCAPKQATMLSHPPEWDVLAPLSCTYVLWPKSVIALFHLLPWPALHPPLLVVALGYNLPLARKSTCTVSPCAHSHTSIPCSLPKSSLVLHICPLSLLTSLCPCSTLLSPAILLSPSP